MPNANLRMLDRSLPRCRKTRRREMGSNRGGRESRCAPTVRPTARLPTDRRAGGTPWRGREPVQNGRDRADRITSLDCPPAKPGTPWRGLFAAG
jgi:hypothetical protein